MNKVYLLLLTALILSACSNENSDNETAESNENNGQETDELIVEEEDRNTDENSETNQNDEHFLQMLEEFTVDNYAEDSAENFRHTEELLSEDMLELLNSDIEAAEDNIPDVERTVEEIELYQSYDNSNQYMYVLTLRFVDEDSQNIELTERYGEITTTDEDGEQKIDDIQEIGYSEVGMGN